MTKGVREVSMIFYEKYLDAIMEENGIERVMDIENNQLPSTVTIEEDGKIKNYRLKPFQRTKDKRSYLDTVYIYIS